MSHYKLLWRVKSQDSVHEPIALKRKSVSFDDGWKRDSYLSCSFHGYSVTNYGRDVGKSGPEGDA